MTINANSFGALGAALKLNYLPISNRLVQADYAFYGEPMGVRIARKHLGWYAKDRPENTAFRAVANAAQTAEDQLRLTRDYFGALAEDAAAAA